MFSVTTSDHFRQSGWQKSSRHRPPVNCHHIISIGLLLCLLLDFVAHIMKVCPLALAAFAGSAAAYILWKKKQEQQQEKESLPSCQVVFVLGGPGAGKGTQCELIQQNFSGWAHLSAGDLLRAERKQGGALGDAINAKIAAGQLVPAEITVGCLEKGMLQAFQKDGTTKFLIDGFPRNQDNVNVWQNKMPHHTVTCILYFDCPEEVLVGRLLERGQTSGRSDDNLDVIRKRFKTFQQESYPIVEFYESQGKVERIRSDQSVDQVYAKVEALFNNM
jgi:UMP-CMP kinase